MKKLITTAIATLVAFYGYSQQISITNDQYHLYGPNSTWGEYLQIGGNGKVTSYAAVSATNGNLHLDSKEGAFAIYLNHYSQGNTLINTQGGKVGIGTYTPAGKLQVNSTNNGTGTIDWIAGNFGGSAGDRVVMGILRGVASIGAHTNGLNAWSNFSINPDGGNVGIGTTTPNSKLSIISNSTGVSIDPIGGTYYGGLAFNREVLTGAIFNPSGNAFQINNGGPDGNLHIQVYNGAGTSITGNALVVAGATGNIGIGVSDPQGYKLAVAGKIRATEIKVEALPWSDFVFEPSYKLRDLKSTEQFIKENKHLPEIPSAAEVAKDGINVGEMNAKLLQKIEELTLYMIEQNKESVDLRKIIQQQNERITNLEKQNKN